MVQAKVVSNSSSEVKSKLALYLAVIGLSIALFPALASAQTAPPPVEAVPPATSPAPPVADRGPRMVGGHVGLAVPLVTFHVAKPAGSPTTTSISDQFTIATPIGVSVHLNPDWVFDFETIVANDVSPWGFTHFTVDPGMVYTGGPLAFGMRVKFDIFAPANVGIIPLVNKGLVPIEGIGTWFIEAALPITATKVIEGQGGGSITLVLHTGIGF